MAEILAMQQDELRSTVESASGEPVSVASSRLLVPVGGETSTAQLARPLWHLVDYLCGANSFPDGAALATGTGIVPDMEFRLRPGDVVEIDIEQVGRLVSRVEIARNISSGSTSARPDPGLRRPSED